jgi:hypothetical protein
MEAKISNDVTPRIGVGEEGDEVNQEKNKK